MAITFNANSLVNLAAERSVLGAMIDDEVLIPEVLRTGLQTADFSLSDHRKTFDSIVSLFQQKSPVDYISVAEDLGNHRDSYVLVASLIEGVLLEKTHILNHVAIIRRKSRLRAAI